MLFRSHSFVIKIQTKMTANRLGPCLHKMVSVNQNAFVKGRRIQDVFFLVHSSTKLHCQKKVLSLLFKMDISRAFDSVTCMAFLQKFYNIVVLAPGVMRW